MLTSKPISTISYNTESYLLDTLNRLTKSNIICEWYYIKHDGEFSPYDNVREKDHIHLYMNPSKRIDTEELRKEFYEVDKTNPKPLGILPCNASKVDDWFLYAIHDATYLAKKGEVKEFAYQWKDIKGYDIDALKRACKHARDTNNKEVVKRDLIMNMGISNAYLNGVLSSRDVLSAIAMKREIQFSDEQHVNDRKYIDALNTRIQDLEQTIERLSPNEDKQYRLDI